MKYYKFIILYFIILLSFPKCIIASFNYSDNCLKASKLIYNLQFDEAKIIIQGEKKLNPSNKIPLVLENTIDFLTLFIGQNKSILDKTKENIDSRIQILRDNPEQTPFYNYCLSELMLQEMLIDLTFFSDNSKISDGLAFYFEFRKIYNLLIENKQLYPSFIPNNLGLSMLQAMSAGLISDYKWAKLFLPASSSISQSLEEMKKVFLFSSENTQYSFLKEESLIFLAFFNMALSIDKKSSLILIPLFSSKYFPEGIQNNSLLTYAKSSIFSKNGFNDIAIETLLDYKLPLGAMPYNQMDYFTGKLLLNKLDDRAALYLFKYILNSKGQNLIKSAYQFLAWHYLLNNNDRKYSEYISKAFILGTSNTDADRLAFSEASKKQKPNIVLLRTRLLFDGGYYDKALKELLSENKNIFIKTNKDSVEYFYRLGRIYHEKDEAVKAVYYYNLSIYTGKYHSYYFCLNATYQIGILYENKKQYNMALQFYNQCLSMKSDEYEKGIKRKAKAGIKRIDSIKK